MRSNLVFLRFAFLLPSHEALTGRSHSEYVRSVISLKLREFLMFFMTKQVVSLKVFLLNGSCHNTYFYHCSRARNRKKM